MTVSEVNVTLPAQPPQRFITAGGARLYRIPMRVFANGMIGYAHLVLGRGAPVLIDCGSERAESIADLFAGLNAIGPVYGERFTPGAVGRVWLTHAHIDHIGGAPAVQAVCGAPIAVHAADRAAVEDADAHIAAVTARFAAALGSYGFPADTHPALLRSAALFMGRVPALSVASVLEDGAVYDGMAVLHTPGHTAGQVCICIDDVLISADHVLSATLPHQTPAALYPGTGLGVFLESSTRLAALDGVRLALGGHDAPIPDVRARLISLNAQIERRLARIEARCAGPEPPTLAALAASMEPPGAAGRSPYLQLLTLEMTAAFTEYLCAHGRLQAAPDGAAARYSVRA
jgi:glyoxylase-like metal-dependent hydrolase (beta-lactamase superfamily II)